VTDLKEKDILKNLPKVIMKIENEIEVYIDNAQHTMNVIQSVKQEGDSVYAAIEDYSYGSYGSTTKLAEGMGVLKSTLYHNIILLRTYSPMLVKNFACPGKRAEKLSMFDALKNKWDFETMLKKGSSPLGDMIDAIWLLSLLYVELKAKKGLELTEYEKRTVTKNLSKGPLVSRGFENVKST